MVFDKDSLPAGYSDNGLGNKAVMVPSTRPSNSIWPTAKPLVNGGLVGLFSASVYQLALFFPRYSHNLAKFAGYKDVASQINKSIICDPHYKSSLKEIPGVFLLLTAQTSLLLGLFEIMKRKVEAANKEMPLTLCQEVACGTASAAIAGSVAIPIYFANTHVMADSTQANVLQAWYHKARNEGVLALWKGGRHKAIGSIIFDMPMLVSYNRCLNYFRESLGLKDTQAVLGAGIASGFFASTCSLPYWNVHRLMQLAQSLPRGENPFTSYWDCAFKMSLACGPQVFFSGFTSYFLRAATPITMIWFCWEKIRKLEESNGW